MVQLPTLLEVVDQRAGQAPLALSFDDCPLAELRRRALRIAIELRKRGLAGRAVLVAAPAGLDYVTSLLGCLYAGAIAVPAYPPTARLSRANERIDAIMKDAGVSTALIAGEQVFPADLGLATLEVSALRTCEIEPVFNWDVAVDRPCLLQYTSGSTAEPKGIALTLRQLTSNLAAMRDAMQAGTDDVMVTWLPPYHDMGLIGGILGPLFTGVATSILSPDAFIRSPLRWLHAITERRATITMAPNFAFDLCVRRIPEARRAGIDLSSLRVLCNGAEPIHPASLEAFAEAFGPYGFDRRALYPCYGLAEATLFVTGGKPGVTPVVVALERSELKRDRAIDASDSPAALRLVGCGEPAPGTSVRIVDPQTRRLLAEDQVGEIWVASPSVALGYWNHPEETAATFQAQLSDAEEGPFLRTGDLGFIRHQQLFITGRLKDLIIVRGQNHYPHDIERTVQRRDPALAASPGAAFSIDLAGEERLVIVQEIDHRLGADPKALLPSILEAVRAEHGIAVHACVLVRRSSIERTASGKVQRRRTRQAFLDGRLDEVARWQTAAFDGGAPATLPCATPATESQLTRRRLDGNPRRRLSIARFLRARVARLAGIEPDAVDEHVPLARYGVDSLHAAELTHELEQFLGMPLPETISFDAPTVAALADALSAASRILTQPPREERDPGAAEPDGSAAGEDRRDDALAIVGMSCRFPGAPDLERFWSLLEHGEDAVGEVPRERTALATHPAGCRYGGFIEGIDRFDAEFFGISAREAARMDPQQRLFLELAWSALEDAAIPPSSLRGSDTGVFAGVGSSDYALLHAGRLELVDADSGVGHAASVVANRVSYTLDLRGPSLTIDTACSSSLVALHLASQSLRSGESSLAIVGGVNAVLAPEASVFLLKARTLAGDGRSKTFDARADGFARSEGCGVIVLKRLRDAIGSRDRIYAVLQGTAVNHDGASNGLMAPSGPAQERLVRTALGRAGVTPDQLDYVEAHGVGAPLSDAIELTALGRVLSGRRAPQPCWVGSVKTNLGHLEAASGIAGVIKTALALTHETLPAHLHLREVARPIELERLPIAIPTESTPWPRTTRARYAGVSAFGIGGANAHVVLREGPLRPARRPRGERPTQLLALSAKDPVALQKLAASLRASADTTPIAELCYSANTGRDHFAHRAAIVASDAVGLRAALASIEAGQLTIARRRDPRLTFAFGEHLPSAGAARELYAREPAFRRALERGAVAAGSVLEADLLPPLLSDAPPRQRSLAAIDPSQPFLEFPQTSAVLLHYALTALFEHWGVQPSLVYGCGPGEYAAACVAGVLGWQDALRLSARRELLLGSLIPGGRVRQTLHQFKTALAALDYCAPQLPLATASLGRALRADETLDRAHWLEHLYARTEPDRGLSALAPHEPELTLVLGPGGDPGAAGDERAVRLRCVGGASDHVQLLRTLGTLYERGCEVDWRAFHAGFECERAGIPGYPFQRQRCWLDVPPPAARPEPIAAAISSHPFLSRLRGSAR